MNRQPTAEELNNVKQETVQWDAKAHRVIAIDSDGDAIGSDNPLPVQLPGFELPSYDTIDATYPTTSTEVYTYTKDGSSVAVITVTYTDDTKSDLLKVEKA